VNTKQDPLTKFHQYLDADGALLKPIPKQINNRDFLVSLYRTLILTRLFDETAVNLQRTGAIGTYAQSRGQEAIGTAIGKAMLVDDVFIPYYRDLATQIQRGVLLEEFLQYWGGDERGSHFAHQTYDFPLCVPIATQLCHAIGVAFALKYRNRNKVAVVTCGDGATSKGDFYESLNVAGVMSLPVLFVVNNNQWAISVPLDHQTAAKNLADKATSAGIQAMQIDGNDTIAMYLGVQQALDKIRQSGHPILIEAISYRICDHTTADDSSRYMNQQALDDAIRKEPITRYHAFLTREYSWSLVENQQLIADCQLTIDKAVNAYTHLEPQQSGEFFDYMYDDLPRELEEQKQIFLDGLKHHG
jgi:pyruvate dehydrogenase E1 component alpha subunit